jgi:TPR repeat protein
MKRFLFCLLLAASGSAAADSLSEANRLLAEKSYGEAFPVFQMLAHSGNAEAKLRLGQMYWYGQGVAADRAKADHLFAEAGAAGNKEAQDALTLSHRREARSGEIAKWSAYDGADLAAGKYACPQPAIGEVSKTNDEIKATMSGYQAWAACYNGFVSDLDGPLAPSRRIPADLVALMSESEHQQALAHVSEVTQAAVGKVGANAQMIMASYDKWEKATKAFADEHNASVEARKTANKQLLDNEERIRRDAANSYVPPPVPASRPSK